MLLHSRKVTLQANSVNLFYVFYSFLSIFSSSSKKVIYNKPFFGEKAHYKQVKSNLTGTVKLYIIRKLNNQLILSLNFKILSKILYCMYNFWALPNTQARVGARKSFSLTLEGKNWKQCRSHAIAGGGTHTPLTSELPARARACNNRSFHTFYSKIS